MKVLHVITSLKIGGAEKLLVDSIPLYVEKGNTVDILLLDGEETIFTKELKEQKICNIYDLKVSMRNPFAIFKIRPYLKKYDIIHVHLFPTLYWVVFASFFLRKVPKLIYTEHNTYNRRRDKKYFKIVEKFIYGKYNRLVAISDETRDNLADWLDLDGPADVLTIYNGINISKFKGASSFDKELLGIPSDNKVILMTARFDTQKDQNTLIRSMALLNRPDVSLVFVGDGPLKKDSMELVSELGLDEQVLFLGIRSDVPQLMKMADVCVLSSHYEGLSLASIESLASGNPFVASNVPGLKDIVDGVGLLFNESDAEDLKNKLLEVLDNEDRYNEVALACSERAKLYDITQMVSSYMSQYEDMIGQ